MKKKTKDKGKKRKKKNSEKRSEKRNKLRTGILITGIILAIIILTLILLSTNTFEGPKEQQLFELQDECSLVMGNLIHQIRNSGDCRIRCVNECKVRELEFVRTEFASEESSCNACDCYCK